MSQASWNIEEIVREVVAALQGEGSGSGSAAKPEQATETHPEEVAGGRSGPLRDSPSAVPPVGCPQTPGPRGATSIGPPNGISSEGRAMPGAGQYASDRKQVDRASAQPGAEQVRISSRLVTMAELRACGVPENLAGLRRVVVRPDALITPLVRDELQRRNIPLVLEPSLAGEEGRGSEEKINSVLMANPASVGQFAEAKHPRSGAEGFPGPREAGPMGLAETAPSKPGLVLMIHGKAYEPAGLVRRLAAEGTPVEVQQMDCIVRATDQLAEALRPGHCLGVLLTGYAAIGVCAANRHGGVRAVWGMEPAQAASDTASLGANLLVINPRQVSPYQLEKMIREFWRAGLRPCPQSLKSRLG